MIKRTLDFVAALLGLVVLSPLLAVIAVLIRLDSKGPVFFRQERVGRRFRPFVIYKFRSMVEDAPAMGGEITSDNDPRVTRVGRMLRRTKLDELPQLVNVLRGDMSVVGPRPEVPRFVELFRHDYRQILEVRPGITDLASLKYRDEAAVLGQRGDPDEEYVTRILPEKIMLAKEYVSRSSLTFDLMLVARTLLNLFARKVTA